MGPGARITSTRRLRGGSSSAVHAIDVENARGRHRLVLRRFTLPAWQEPEGAEREARILSLLKGTRISVPELVAVDAHAEHCDVPALLMTRLPGRLDLQPRDVPGWARQLAEPLPAIHAVKASPRTVPQYEPYFEPSLAPPAWSRHPDAWRALDTLVRGKAPRSRPVFIHRDYHPANVLWRGGRVTGVLDWINASIGPHEIDVAHCRVDIGCLAGVEAADTFLKAYCALVGESVTEWNPYWDAHVFCDVGAATDRGLFEGWQGVVSLETVHARNDAFAASIAARC